MKTETEPEENLYMEINLKMKISMYTIPKEVNYLWPMLDLILMVLNSLFYIPIPPISMVNM